MSDQVADVLDDAADLLEREGWIQGDLWRRDSYGGRCALGAICDAALDNRNVRVAAARAVLGGSSTYLVDWNDTPGRTKQEVLDAFRAAAKQERMRPETPASPRTPERGGAGVGLAGGDAETRTRPADESHPPT
jgi:hypothetical protein